ncbi:hypothetical protein ACFOPQ_09645 [Deinococcus antarcticus]|uniref:Lipoprotein n=1 Tax=Deinococcus antarcticus TaxID=1298767 RepID=A0ABV8A9B2_9DEIO
MKTLPYISTAALLGITLSACNGNKEPTAADFTSLLKNISEQHCTDLTKLPMDLNTYYNEIPNDPKHYKYKLAIAAKLVEPGSGPILKPTARYAEIKAKIKDGKLCDGTYTNYVVQSANETDDGSYRARVTREFKPEPWTDEGIQKAFFFDKPVTELTYLFQKSGKDWQGTPQNQ